MLSYRIDFGLGPYKIRGSGWVGIGLDQEF